jgi:NarL family two-component system sensor histidine kinase LiaS
MQESERVKLARSLHDGIAQDLVGLSYRLQLLLADEETPLHMRAGLRESIYDIDLLSKKVRDEIFALRERPIFISIAELRAELALSTDAIRVEILTRLDDLTLIPWQLLQICQELVRNASAHAGASRIEIALTIDNDQFSCLVHDDGSGEISLRPGHYGLVGIQELLSHLRGEIHIDREGSRRITLTFPNTHSSS